jgi:hypothetical protein
MLRTFRRCLRIDRAPPQSNKVWFCALIAIVLIIAFDVGNGLVAARVRHSCLTLTESAPLLGEPWPA